MTMVWVLQIWLSTTRSRTKADLKKSVFFLITFGSLGTTPISGKMLSEWKGHSRSSSESSGVFSEQLSDFNFHPRNTKFQSRNDILRLEQYENHNSRSNSRSDSRNRWEPTWTVFTCPCVLAAFFQELGWSPRSRHFSLYLTQDEFTATYVVCLDVQYGCAQVATIERIGRIHWHIEAGTGPSHRCTLFAEPTERNKRLWRIVSWVWDARDLWPLFPDYAAYMFCKVAYETASWHPSMKRQGKRRTWPSESGVVSRRGFQQINERPDQSNMTLRKKAPIMIRRCASFGALCCVMTIRVIFWGVICTTWCC